MNDRSNERTRWLAKNVLPHERSIRAWLSHRRVQELDIDDIIQEMYAKIGSIKDLEQIHTPKSYAYQVAHSILLSHARRSQIVTIVSEGNLEDLGIASGEASPEDVLAFKDEIKAVWSVIDAFPPRTREVFRMRRIEGLSQKEAAERLNVSEKAIEKHMTNAVYLLVKQFGRGGKTALRTSKTRQDGNRDDNGS